MEDSMTWFRGRYPGVYRPITLLRLGSRTVRPPDAKPKVDKRGDDRQGTHPHHGKTTSGTESFNYNLDTDDNQWHCFAAGHNSGGGTMEMAAIMAGKLDCADAGEGTLDQLSDEAFLWTCLYARDNLSGFTADMDLPYRALVALARIFDLPMVNEDRGILGETNYRYARAIYDEASTEDL